MSERMAVERIADEFGLPIQWAQLHVGEHRCVDGRMYLYSCLVTDPETTAVAKSYMRRAADRAAEHDDERRQGDE